MRWRSVQQRESCCAARVAPKQNETMGSFLPTTIHTVIVAGSTPSPQSLRDSSPQAGEQFKVTPCGVVFLRATRPKDSF